MQVRLVILGLLRERPLHGYEIKHVIEDHMGNWTSIAFGSIYFALDKMAGEGLIERAGTEKPGRRPSRSVYRITGAGQAEFMRLLRETWSDVERHYHAFDIGLFFMRSLSGREVEEYLDRRLEQLESIIKGVEEHRRHLLEEKGVPKMAGWIIQHSLAHFQAEMAWTKELAEVVKRGEFGE